MPNTQEFHRFRSLTAAITLGTPALAEMSLTSSNIDEGQNMDKRQEGIGFG